MTQNTPDNEPGEALKACGVCTDPDTVLCFCDCHGVMHCFECMAKARTSVAAVAGDARCEVSYTGQHRIDAPYCKDCGRVFTAPAASSPLPAEPPSDAKFVPPAEDALHIAICQAVQEHHGPSANAILRAALNDYKPTQLTRTELIRIQQRSGTGEVAAVMVSPAEPAQPPTEELTAASVLDQSLNTLRQIRDLAASSRSYVPQDIAAEMMLRLEALGFGSQEPRRGNTLWAMVMDAADEIEQLRPAPAQPAPKDEKE